MIADVDALLGGTLEHTWEGKSATPTTREGGSVTAAEAAAERLPAAVSGHEGGKTCLKSAIEIGKITGDEATTLDILRRVYNPRCLPPWSDAELEHKASEAHKKIAESEARTASTRSGLAPARERLAAQKAEAPEPPETNLVPVAGDPQLDSGPKGAILKTVTNVLRVLEFYGWEKCIRLDSVRGRIVVCGINPEHADIPDGMWQDVYTTEVRRLCERHNLLVEKGVAADAIEMHAHRFRFNSMHEWLTQCAANWDGVPRVDGALRTYWRVEDAHADMISRVWLLSMVARMLEPGCEVQTCLVMLSDQGYGKSRSLKALVSPTWFSDSPLMMGDKDAAQALRGKVLWELGENVIATKKSADEIKAFLSQPFDTYRESYGRTTIDVPRTCTFVITANPLGAVLHDPTGARRFMPVHVGLVDVDGILRDREQLFGEACSRLLAGEDFFLTREEAALLAPANEAIGEHDAWEDVIEAWLAKRPNPEAPCTWREITHPQSGALPKQAVDVDPRMQARIAACMRRLGWERVVRRVEGSNTRVYVKRG